MNVFIPLKIGLCFLLPFSALAQNSIDSVFGKNDSLENVVVRAFENNRNLLQTNAAVSIVSSADLKRFGNNSLMPAFNLEPGVRMEERSPGSFRLNIRGSSLRAPFGVRNVKVYLDDMIFTDPGGGTYLNQLGFFTISSAEILKGPPGSMYGAGTGGAVLLQTEPTRWQTGATAELSGGSYGLKQQYVKALAGTAEKQNIFSYQHQAADGYRAQSAMRRNVATYESRIRLAEKQRLSAILMYGDLYYQTPGGLTLGQYRLAPRAARPRAGTQPSAAEAAAAISQKTFYAGVANEYTIRENFKNTTSVYGAFTWFNNPGIRVYEKRIEPHFGARSIFTNHITVGRQQVQLVYGGEAQKGLFTVRTYKNKGGVSDTLLTDDEINNWRYSVFAQADLVLEGGWIITAGASYNKSLVGISRLNSYPVINQERKFGDVLSPRVSLLKSLGKISIYGLVSHGFSAPTTAELVPSNGSINNTLSPEKGFNYEAGSRGQFPQLGLNYDFNVYIFRLTDAISQRRDFAGNDYFVNTGGTKQQGTELQLNYTMLRQPSRFLSLLSVGTSYTRQQFTYNNYKVLEADYSGKALPGIPKQFVALTLDVALQPGFYLNATYSYNDKVYMSDANTEYSPSYNLLACRLGFKKLLHSHYQVEIFSGIDNIGDITYSNGNDINAAAGRYYNAAPGRNFYAGISFNWLR